VEAPKPAPVAKRGWWWKWRWPRRVGYVLLALLTLAVGWCCYDHYRLVGKLKEATDALDRDDPGWRLADIEAARAVIPDEQNGARCVVRAVQLLPKEWPPKDLTDALTHLDPPSRLDPTLRERLAAEMDAVRPALEEARKLADMPQGRYPIHYPRNPFDTLLHEQQRARRVFALLDYDALRLAEEGRANDALRSCRATLNAGRSIGDEPTCISLLIRHAGVLTACRGAERVLAQGEPDPAELVAFQRLLTDEDADPGLVVALRGERAMQHELFDAIEAGDVSLTELAEQGKGPDWHERLFGWADRDMLREGHPFLLERMTRRIEIAKLPLHEQAAAERAFDAQFDRLPRRAPASALAVGLLTPALDKASASYRRKIAVVRCLLVALAAERFRRDKGTWPAAADDLAPDYLESVPLDPFDGNPIRYRRMDGGLVVYAVGPDETDDGGNLDPGDASRPGTDIGVRLWDPDKRRQPAPPTGPPD
jgi:hypothetical protein